MDEFNAMMSFQSSRRRTTAVAQAGALLVQAAALCADEDAPLCEIDLNTATAMMLGASRERPARPQGLKRKGFFADQENKHGAEVYLHEWWTTKYYRWYIGTLRDASWYEEEANKGTHAAMRKQFEAAIRMPLRTFQRLLKDMEEDPFMWRNPAKRPVPISVLLMATLRFLALGCVWEGISDIFCVARRTLDVWFKEKFLIWMMTNKYHKYVKTPRTTKELRALEKPFEEAGFPGMFALCDGVHVWWTGYSYGAKNAFKGKEKYPTVVFNVTVDYDGKPIFVSNLAAGVTNDKAIVNNYDEFVGITMQTNPVFTEYRFKLSTKDGTVWTKGAYLGVDNGYHQERRYVAPLKHERCGTWAFTWSKWLESLRKKCECFFGRLKKKYRILTQGINMRQLARTWTIRPDGTVVEVGGVEDIFKVCCCLDVMVQEDKGAFLGTELDWRQLDDAELEEVDARAETPAAAWLVEFKKRQAALDDAMANERRSGDDDDDDDDPEEPPEEPPEVIEEPLEVIAAAQFRPLHSLKELTCALVDHFSRFKAVWRLSHPDVVNHGGQNATYWLMRYQNPRS